MSTTDLPLTMMDQALVVQTMPGRPMTTHHVLEFARPLSQAALERAIEHLVGAHAPLRSRVEETLFGLSRTVEAFDAARARAQLTVLAEPTEFESSGWLDRPFDLAREWPFRVRLGPTSSGAFSLCFTLHHSVTDGHGALALFDDLLRSAVAAEAGANLPALAVGVGEPTRPWGVLFGKGPRFVFALLWTLSRRMFRFWQRRANLHDAPFARHEGFGLRVVPLSAEAWRGLKVRATTVGSTRNDLLCVAALKAAARVRRDRSGPGEALRMLSAVDLRAFFGVKGPHSNWVGTLEVDVTPAELEQPGIEALIHDRLIAARAPTLALVTPVLLGVLGAVLPPRLFREVFRSSDAPGGSFPYSLLVSHLRPQAELCWPATLSPRSLWCASTLPRKPGIGVTVTTVGDNVTLTACWPRPIVLDATVDALLEQMLGELQAGTSAASPERRTA